MPGDSAIYFDDYKPERQERIVEREHREREHRERERPLSTSTSTSKRYVQPKIGNPTPLGLSAFATSVMVTAIYDTGMFGIDRLDMAVGMALFTGGVVQFAAGMWEFKVGNTFGGTGFGAFGGFWASYGMIYLQGFGIRNAFTGVQDPQFVHALGVYCLAWTVFTIIFTMACMRTSMGVLLAFVFLSLDFICLTISYLFLLPSFTVAGGVCGIICSCIVWYCFAAVLLTPELSPISLPLWDLSTKNK